MINKVLQFKTTVFILFFILISLFCLLSQTTYFADTEIWAMNFANYSVSNTETNITLFSKPLFYSLLKVVYFTNESSWNNFLMSRTLFLIISLSTLILVYALITEMTNGDKKTALISVLILLSTSFYLSRGYRVRSDMLATLFFLGASYLLVLFKNNKVKFSKTTLFASIGIILYSILSTPKAIFLALAFFILFLSLYLKPTKLFLKKYILETPLYLIVFFVALFLISLLPIVHNAYTAAWQYYINSFKGQEQWTVTYLSMSSFYYLLMFLKKDFLFAIFIITAIAWPYYPTLKKFRSDNLFQKGWQIVSLFLIFVFLFFPDKLPFYLASLLPIFTVAISFFVQDFVRLLSKKKFLPYVFITTFFCLGLFHSSNLLIHNNNFKQKQLWLAINHYISNFPNAVIYDGIGLFPKIKRVEAFPGQGLADYKGWMLEKINSTQPPDFIIKTERMGALGHDFSELVQSKYAHLGSGLWGRALIFSPDNKKLFSVSTNQFDMSISTVFLKHQAPLEDIFIYPYVMENDSPQVLLKNKNDKTLKLGAQFKINHTRNFNTVILKPAFTQRKFTVFEPFQKFPDLSSAQLFGFDRLF